MSKQRNRKGQLSIYFVVMYLFILIGIFVIVYGILYFLLVRNIATVDKNIAYTIDVKAQQSSLINFLLANAESDMTYAEILGSVASSGISSNKVEYALSNIFINKPYSIKLESKYGTTTLSKGAFSANTQYFNAPGSLQLLLPCDAAMSSSGYGTRDDPVYVDTKQFHYGIDFPQDGSCNDIRAAADGKVVYIFDGCIAGNNDCGHGYGNTIAIGHDFNGKNYQYFTYYSHLSTIYIAKGENVNAGQKIAFVGNTGKSTGKHLDFRVTCSHEGSADLPDKEYTINPCNLFVTPLGERIGIENCEQKEGTFPPGGSKCAIDPGYLKPSGIPTVLDYSKINIEIAMPGAIPGNVKTNMEIKL
ncbi:MAG: M23 family metallopeptidase [Nanoarchaeota archaeon]|nr:M23 family metallopeptidase [Nanoarchaeota archaeon]